MEISPFTVYLWQQADSIISACSGGYVFTLGFICVVSGLAYLTVNLYIHDTGCKDEFLKHLKSIFLPLFVVTASLVSLAGIGSVFIPSSKTIAVMYAVPAIVNSPAVQKDLPELYQMGVSSLKEQLAPKTPAKLEIPAK